MLKIFFFALFFIGNLNALHYAYKDDVLELIREAGYKGESHRVETEDGGWFLKMHRIPPKNNQSVKRLPVFLMHGLLAASADYLILGKNSALAYLLADNNYDVWLGNSRGNRHATVNYKTADLNNLWDFSYNEIGQFDLPAMIDYVLAYTKAPKVLYVGHSQGTTSLIVLLSTRPEYNQKIAQAHLLAAVAYQKHLPNPIIRQIAKPLADNFIITGQKMFNLGNILIFGNPLSKVLCNETINYHTTQLCKEIIFAITGRNAYGVELDPKILPHLVDHISWQASARQLLHYAQGYFSGQFRRYDLGKRGNIVYYNSTEPPEYNLKNIQAPFYIYRGPEDLLTSKPDVERLISQLQNVRHYQIIPNYNHVDFTYGKRSRKILYYDILKFFDSESGDLRGSDKRFY